MSGSADLSIALSVRMGQLEANLRQATNRLKGIERGAREAQTAMDRMGRSMSGFGSQVSAGLGLARTHIVAMVAALSTAALGGGLASAVRNVNALADAAGQVGLEARQLQAIQVAFEEAGSSAQTAEQALGRVATLVGDAARGSKEAQETFVRLGVSFQNLDGTARSTEQVFDDVAARIRAAASEQEKLSIAADVFGQRAARGVVAAVGEMGGSINETVNRFRALGIVIGPETAQRLDSLGTAFANLGRVIVTAIADAVAAVGPYIVSLIERITSAVRWGIRQIQEFAGWARRMGQAMGLIEMTPLDQAQRSAAETAAQHEDNLARRQRAINGIIQTAREQNRELTEEEQGAIAGIEAYWSGRLERSTDAYVAARNALREMEESLREPEETRPQAGATPRVTAGGGGGRQRTEEWERQREALLNLADPYRQLEAQVRQASALWEAGRLSADEYTQVLEALGQRMQQVADRAANATQPVEGFWDAFARGVGATGKGREQSFNGQLGEGLGQIAQGAFGDLMNLFDKVAERSMKAGEAIKQFALNFVKSIAQMVAQAAAMRMISAFLGGAGGGGGGVKLGGARMAGGAVAGGYAYLVGERGPEIFMAPGSGRIVPNHALGGGGMNVVVNQNAPGVVVRSQQIDERTVMLAVNMSREQVAADFAESTRTGHGSFAEPLGRHYSLRRRM